MSWASEPVASAMGHGVARARRGDLTAKSRAQSRVNWVETRQIVDAARALLASGTRRSHAASAPLGIVGRAYRC